MIAYRLPHRRRRKAATLTEVLMALLVMGIGLTSVMYIFPLSLLRAIDATKLTHATLLRQNAEARIKASVSNRLDPVTGAVITIPHAIVEDPDFDGITWEHDATKFVFDPLGAWIASSDGTGPTIQTTDPSVNYYNATTFGDFNRDGQSDPVTSPAFIERFTFNLDDIDKAREFVTLPDSYISLFDQLAGNFTYAAGGTSVGIAANLSEYTGQSVRVTALQANTGKSAVRMGTVNTAGNAVDIAEPFPTGYSAGASGTIGRLMIDLPEQRYTWLATVRRFGVEPSITVVVFFRRSFSPDDEKVYLCGEPAGSYNEFTYDATDNGGEIPAGLVAGGWMFDAYTFRWWKISAVTKLSDDLYRFNVDPEEYDPSAAARGVGTPKGPVYAMFPRNVVEAYTLKKD